MTDKHEIDARYRYWRRHILLTIWLATRCFTSRVKSLTPPPEILHNGVSAVAILALVSEPVLHYHGVSLFRHCQRSPIARYFMGIGPLPRHYRPCLFRRYGRAFAVLGVLNAFFQGWVHRRVR